MGNGDKTPSPNKERQNLNPEQLADNTALLNLLQQWQEAYEKLAQTNALLRVALEQQQPEPQSSYKSIFVEAPSAAALNFLIEKHEAVGFLCHDTHCTHDEFYCNYIAELRKPKKEVNHAKKAKKPQV